MVDAAGPSLALFAAVWSLLCLLSGAVVFDALLRGAGQDGI